MSVEGLWEFMTQDPCTRGGNVLVELSRGVIVLEGGKFLGGDSGNYWVGSYDLEQDQIMGSAKVTNISLGSDCIFGNDFPQSFTVEFSGTVSSTGSLASILGHLWPDGQPASELVMRLDFLAALPT